MGSLFPWGCREGANWADRTTTTNQYYLAGWTAICRYRIFQFPGVQRAKNRSTIQKAIAEMAKSFPPGWIQHQLLPHARLPQHH